MISIKRFWIKFKILIKKIRKADLYVKKYQTTALSTVMPSYAYINWGKYLAMTGNLNEAIEKFETSSFMAQQIPEAYINLGLVYANLQEYEKAAKNFKKAIKLDGTCAKAYSLLASVLMEFDEVEEAQYLYQKANKLDPRDSEIYVNWAISLLKLDKKQEAMDKFKLAMLYNPNNFIASHMWGVALFENNQTDAAIHQFEYTLSYNPNDYMTLYYLACCHLRLGQFEKALLPAKKSLLINPKKIETYMLLGELCLKLNDETKCLKYFEDARQLGLKSLRLTMSHAMALKHFKYFEQAREKFKEILEEKPDNLMATYNLAVCELCLDNEEEGFKLLTRTIEIKPNYTEALYNLGIYYFKHANYDAAIDYFKKVLGISVNNHKNVYFDIANCYAAKKDFENAIKYYSKNVEYYPDFVDAYVNLSTVYLETQNYMEAQRKIRTAHKLAPEDLLVNYTYGIVYLESKLYKEAQEKFEYVLSKDDSEKGAFWGYIECLINLNNPKEALVKLDNVKDREKQDLAIAYVKAYVRLAYIEPSYYNIEKARESIAYFKEKYPNSDKSDAELDILNKIEVKTGE